MGDDVTCAICGFPVDLSDPDVQLPPPDWVCGECFRAREFDDLLWEAGE